MTDILDLEGWHVLFKARKGDEYEIEAEYTVQPEACQKCGVIGELYRHGPKVVSYRDSPIRGYPARILAKVQRYKCRGCGGTFLQPLGGIQADMRMTERCVSYITDQCLRDTFLRIAEHVGCDDKTIRNIAGQYIARLNANYEPYLPEWLGIDETQIDGKMRCIITDVGCNQPIDMLPDRDKGSVVSWLHRFRDRGVVKGVAIDMWRPYLDAARTVFPGVPVVIDKFHVVRMANSGMEKVRIRLAKSEAKLVGRDWMRRKTLLRLRHANLDEKQRLNLDMWLRNEPDIATAYRLKEDFYAIYDCPTKEDAAEAMSAWKASVPTSMKSDFKELSRAMTNWQAEILAFFDHPISNGYTEALNGVAKQINRAGRGYSFDVLRARVLFKARKALPADSDPVEFPGAEIENITTERRDRAKLRQTLLAKSDGRCMSCQGVFSAKELYVSTMSPVVKGEPTQNAALLCLPCKQRFHTKGASRHDSGSTH